MTNSEYHSRPELSCSNIKTLLKNPYEYVSGIKTQQTNAMSLGSCIHKLVLEPFDFLNEFVVSPKFDLRTKEGKQQKADFELQCVGKTVIDDESYKTATECASIIRAIAGKFFSDGNAEESFFSELAGIPVKCRPDYYIKDQGIVVDIKTTNDASHDGFNRSVANFGYHIQQAFYTDVLESLGNQVKKFVFVAIETKAPHMIGIYELDQAYIDLGRAEYQRGFDIYRKLDEFKAPIYKDMTDLSVIQTLTPPTYLFYKNGAVA